MIVNGKVRRFRALTSTSIRRNSNRDRSRAIAAAALAALSISAGSNLVHAGVTVTATSVGTATAWPGSPVITTAPPNVTPLVPENLDNGRVVSQIFTPASSFTLDQLAIYSSGGPGDSGTSITSIHLFDINNPHSLPGS